MGSFRFRLVPLYARTVHSGLYVNRGGLYMKRKANLTEGPIGRRLFYLTVPMVMGIFAMVAFSLADTYFVAKLGTTQLAAMSFMFPVVMLVHSLAFGLGMGTVSVLSRAIGRGDHREIRRLTTHSLMLAFLVVLLLVLIGLATIGPLFTLLGAGPDVLPFIRQYMTVWYVGMVFVTVPMVGNNAIRATGDTTIPGLIMIAAAGINICLDPLLIFGLAGFPRLELVGAALATVIARALALILSLSILHFREKMIEFSMSGLRNLWDSWKKVLYIGMPAAATTIMVPLSMGIVVRFVARFGTAAVAAVGAGIRVQAFAMMVTIALGASLIPFVGQNWGARKFERVHRARHISNRFSFLWGLLCAAALFMAAVPIGRLFSDEPEVVNNIASYLCIVPLSYGMLGIARLTAASFNAINRPLVSATMTIIHMFVLYIPLAYVGSHLLGLRGLFAGIGLANIVAGAIALFVTAWARREEPTA